MSRVIEFRMWDKKEKEYPRNQEEFLMDNKGNLFCFEFNDVPTPLAKDDYIIEWYTGRKDKNGKKIFEGDILFGREEGNGETTAWTDVYYIVFFNVKYGRWQVREKSIKEDSCWCDDLVDIIDDYEITGTIHNA